MYPLRIYTRSKDPYIWPTDDEALFRITADRETITDPKEMRKRFPKPQLKDQFIGTAEVGAPIKRDPLASR